VNLVLDIPRPFLPITNGCRYHYRIGWCVQPFLRLLRTPVRMSAQEWVKAAITCCSCSGWRTMCVASLVAVRVSRDCEGAWGKQRGSRGRGVMSSAVCTLGYNKHMRQSCVQ
jgi:hypothetical protein